MPGPRHGGPQRQIPQTPHRQVLPLGIEVTVSAGTATVVLRGELDPATRPVLARRLGQVLADGPQQLVLDLSGVTFIDCASARLITGAGRHLPTGTRPVIRFPSLVARRVLTLTGLVDHLEMRPADADTTA